MNNTDDMFCHNPACDFFNEAQSFSYRPASWDAPSEWNEDPECRECGGDCMETRIDTKGRLAMFFGHVGLDILPVDADDFYQAMHYYVKEEWSDDV